MLKFLPLLFPLLLMVSCTTQERIAGSDKIPTDAGPLQIKPVLHSSFVMQWNDLTIYVDPHGGAENYRAFPTPDIILITDIHGDHLDLETLDSIDLTQSKFVAPEAVAQELPGHYHDQLTVMANDEEAVVKGLAITAIPMYNLPESDDAYHPRGRGNGYVVEIGGKRIYVSGDTEDIPEVRNLENIDVAFLCMNLPYTMSVEQAVATTLDFQPKIIYPYHFRGQNGYSDVEAFKSMVNAENEEIEVRIRDWYME